VLFGAVIRGDRAPVRIGQHVSIGDRSVLNTVDAVDTGFSPALTIGNRCVIGPNCILTSCEIESFVDIGAGSIVQEGSVICCNSVVAPGTFMCAAIEFELTSDNYPNLGLFRTGSNVLPGTFIPRGQYWAGNPAKFIRNIVHEEEVGLEFATEKHLTLGMLAFSHLFDHSGFLTIVCTAGNELEAEFFEDGVAYQDAERKRII
jgi:carbonic anhydrase/acetyltransferase-like protein (isoleucine patch superfamily)